MQSRFFVITKKTKWQKYSCLDVFRKINFKNQKDIKAAIVYFATSRKVRESLTFTYQPGKIFSSMNALKILSNRKLIFIRNNVLKYILSGFWTFFGVFLTTYMIFKPKPKYIKSVEGQKKLSLFHSNGQKCSFSHQVFRVWESIHS